MMHLRQPILLPKEEPLRALIHARFSTEKQRQSSIDEQVASCRTFLESNLPKGWKPEQVLIDVIAEPEVSGEIADRPGINQVWAGIEAKRWHLIVAEESSRLYRHHTKAGELFESAVDADVRVICTSDYIDTAADDWPDRLHMSQMQHARSNFYTRKRIERAHDGLWARGAAVGNTVIGYKRRPTMLATETEPAKGPFFDVIDEEKAVVIREVFERIAAGRGGRMARLDQVREGQVVSTGEVDGGQRQRDHSPHDLPGLRDLPQEEGEAEAANRQIRVRLERRGQDSDTGKSAPADRVGSPLVPGQQGRRQATRFPEAGSRCRPSASRHDPAASWPARRRVQLRRVWCAHVLVRETVRLVSLLRLGDGALVSLTARLAEREQELVTVRARRR
jgi:hypothetical protein